jgi:hypothetical protein
VMQGFLFWKMEARGLHNFYRCVQTNSVDVIKYVLSLWSVY